MVNTKDVVRRFIQLQPQPRRLAVLQLSYIWVTQKITQYLFIHIYYNVIIIVILTRFQRQAWAFLVGSLRVRDCGTFRAPSAACR